MQLSFNAIVGLLVATAVVAIPTPDTNVVSSIEARDNDVVNLFFDQSFKGQAFPITVKDGACSKSMNLPHTKLMVTADT